MEERISPSKSSNNEAETKNGNSLAGKKEHLSRDAHLEAEGDAAKQGETEESLDEKTDGHRSSYSDDGFWKKATKYAKKAGEKTLSPALKLYYTAQDSDTPAWAKTTIYGALGYFISPLDAIPDVTPAIGYTDDIGILAGAIAVVAAHIKDEHSDKARETLKRWFN